MTLAFGGVKRSVVRIAALFQRLSTPSLLMQWYYARANVDLGKKIAFDCFPRPHYAFGIYEAARQAAGLGVKSISCIEFGVAGGAGLLEMERLALAISDATQVRCNLLGFDLGSGLCVPKDFRDLPYAWQSGMYKMNHELLRKKLTTARLVIGDVEETVPQILGEGWESPLGFVSFDLDYYSSTISAFKIFELPVTSRLPRVFCYFDDLIGGGNEYHCSQVGELAAIRDYNKEDETRFLSKINGLHWKRPVPAPWNDSIYIHHDVSHPQYNQFLDFGQPTNAPIDD